MRWSSVCLLALLVSVSACKREPTFDERYEGAKKAISEKALELDKDIAARASEAQTADDSQALGAADSGNGAQMGS